MITPRRQLIRTAAAMLVFAPALHAQGTTPASFTIEQVKSYPFPNELTAAPEGNHIAWALDESGIRNIYVAEGPTFTPRRLTSYRLDDGQELTSVSISADGNNVVYVRGGDHSGNRSGTSPNPLSNPIAPEIQIWSVPFNGGVPRLLGAGESPTISPNSKLVAFERAGAIWTVSIDGSSKAERLFTANGSAGDAQWSPDGTRMAFTSRRGDHAFIGIYTNDSTRITWIDPGVTRDGDPRWSPDGKRLVFVRRPGSGGAPDSILVQRPSPWSLWTADASTGSATKLWTSPLTLRGSPPGTQGGVNLHWGAYNRIVFMSEMDGWPHLYSILASGGEPLLLTPGNYMAEYITMSPDGRYVVFCGNAGELADDVDRRHIVKAPINRAAPQVLTPGTGLEWTPVVTGDGSSIAFISATAQRPPLPAVMPAVGNMPGQLLGASRIPADFPTSQLVKPRKVVFNSIDGLQIHGQLFEKAGVSGKKPAIIFVHGGPPRQMLLGWHYSDYYANAYASNQYLASQGYVVLSVNYRLGIGYGREFHRPPNSGAQGAAEYQDVKAAGLYLRTLPQVDPARIGIYGGSYGGFLTAMALAHDSDIFAAGVDIHGVHDWTAERARRLLARDSYETSPDAARALEVAWTSSPISAMSTWKSPVLLIHADDDRNVDFSQTVDLVQRLTEYKVPFELMVIPDDTHHMMRRHNWVKVDSATAAFFDKHFRGAATQAGERQP